MKVSFCSLGCPSWDLYGIDKRAKEYGYHGVDLRIGGNQHVDASMSNSERKEVRALFEGNGIVMPCLAGYSHFCS